MKKIISTSLLVSVIAMASCTSAEKKSLPGKINKLSWLLGRWESKSDEGMLSETWAKLNDSTFTAETYFEIQGDTVFTEKIRLEEDRKGISYVPVVSDQNDGKPIIFKLIYSGKESAVFENKAHDFPQRIQYNVAGDSLTAIVSGMEKGLKKQEIFSMKRSD